MARLDTRRPGLALSMASSSARSLDDERLSSFSEDVPFSSSLAGTGAVRVRDMRGSTDGGTSSINAQTIAHAFTIERPPKSRMLGSLVVNIQFHLTKKPVSMFATNPQFPEV